MTNKQPTKLQMLNIKPQKKKPSGGQLSPSTKQQLPPIKQPEVASNSNMPNNFNRDVDGSYAVSTPSQSVNSKAPSNVVAFGNRNNNNNNNNNNSNANMSSDHNDKEVEKVPEKPSVYDSVLEHNEKYCKCPDLRGVLNEFGYTYIKPVGSGGSATCYLVHSKKYDMFFVCKEIEIKSQPDSNTSELEALKQLDHPQVIHMYNYKQLDNKLYIFLEYCLNGSLHEYVQNNHMITEEQLISTCYTLLKSLNHIHSHNCAHLDIKPANLLVDKYGRVKIADFGISRFVDSTQQTCDQRAGTILFMAPEILLRSKEYNPFKADIWSMGITFYYLASGKVPWNTSTPEEYIKGAKSGILDFPQGFPEKIKNLIRNMLKIDYNRRPSTSNLLNHEIFDQEKSKDVCLAGITTVDPKSPNAEVEQKKIILSRLKADDNIPGYLDCSNIIHKRPQYLPKQQYQIFARRQLSPRTLIRKNIAFHLSPPKQEIEQNMSMRRPNFFSLNSSSSSRKPQRFYLSMNPNLKFNSS